MESTIEYNPPPAPPLVEYPDQVYVLPHAHHLLGELLPEVVNILWRVNFEEFCLLLIFVVPFAFALAAFLRWLTGRRSAAGGSGDVGALTVLLAQQNKLLVRRLDKMEQQLGDLQRAQRFGDLHKDMAGVVWGLNELKHDIARLQSPSHAGQVRRPFPRASCHCHMYDMLLLAFSFAYPVLPTPCCPHRRSARRLHAPVAPVAVHRLPQLPRQCRLWTRWKSRCFPLDPPQHLPRPRDFPHPQHQV